MANEYLRHFAPELGSRYVPAAIHADGVEIFERVISKSDQAAICCSLGDLAGTRGRAGVRHAMRNPVVAEVANSSSLLRIARATLGGSAVPFRATLFSKALLSNWLVVWHQDTALPLREKRAVPGWGPWSVKEGIIYAHAPADALEQIVALRVHLDDSLAHNGPLRVIRGSHKHGVLSDEEIHQLVVQMPSVECLVPSCGVLAMRPLIVHSSSKSTSEMPRQVLHIEYAASMEIGSGLCLATA